MAKLMERLQRGLLGFLGLLLIISFWELCSSRLDETVITRQIMAYTVSPAGPFSLSKLYMELRVTRFVGTHHELLQPRKFHWDCEIRWTPWCYLHLHLRYCWYSLFSPDPSVLSRTPPLHFWISLCLTGLFVFLVVKATADWNLLIFLARKPVGGDIKAVLLVAAGVNAKHSEASNVRSCKRGAVVGKLCGFTVPRALWVEVLSY